MLGSNNDQLWLLSDEQLKSEATKQGIIAKNNINRYELIDLMIQNDNSNSTSLVTSNNQSNIRTKRKTKNNNNESLPSNIYSMTIDQLLSVIASQGILQILIDTLGSINKLSKNEIIEFLESYMYDKNDNNIEMIETKDEVKQITTSSNKRIKKSEDILDLTKD